jgi:endoglucanase
MDWIRTSLVRAMLLLAACAPALLAGGAGSAQAKAPSGSVFLSASTYHVNENAGALTVTIERTDPAVGEQVRYGVKSLGALGDLDYKIVHKTLVNFAPGQSTTSFNVKIIDRGINGPAVKIGVYLFGAYAQPLGSPSKATVFIDRNDALEVRDPANPLEAPTVSPTGNPLSGVTFFSSPTVADAGVARVASKRAHPAWSGPLSILSHAPTVRRFFMWNEPRYPASLVSGYLEKSEAARPNTAVQLSTYSVVHGHCTGHWSDPPSTVKRFQEFISGVARGIGNFHVVMWLELDSTITAHCLSRHGVYVRMHDELAYAVQQLEKDPHVVVYLDGGAKDALSATEEAKLLRTADVAQAQGFFVNSTHFDWTTKEVAFAQSISRKLGGHTHFVVSTGANGRGPKLNPHPRTQGVEDLCNPPGRGLGPYTTQTGFYNDDGFIWIGTPGKSGGPCTPGAPPTAVFWPSYAVDLARRAVFTVTGPKEHLIRQGTFVNQYPHP